MTPEETLAESQQKIDEHTKFIAEAKARLKEYNETAPKNVKTFHEKQHMMKEIMVAEHGEDYDKTVSTFTINKAEQGVINAWHESLKPEIMALQKGHSPFDDDDPYYGAVGGGLTYSFIPTGVGTIITVKELITGKELNVSDALEWYFYG